MDWVKQYVDFVMRESKKVEQRPGQFLINSLPPGAYQVVTGTLFDPFHKPMERWHVVEWVDNHLILDEQEVIGVFNNNKILWER